MRRNGSMGPPGIKLWGGSGAFFGWRELNPNLPWLERRKCFLSPSRPTNLDWLDSCLTKLPS
jgi:hypothetical protein